MARILILFAHPALEKSRVHSRLISHITKIEGITFHDLYEAYPDLDIDVSQEKQLLLDHDLIILQHPFYWYSCPSIIKQWLDLVLEHGWAYGSGGNALAGKRIFNAISTGGPMEAYQQNGRNRFTIRELLAPFDQTAYLCKMIYLPPFVVPGTHRLKDADIKLFASQYEKMIIAFRDDRISPQQLESIKYLNELFPITEPVKS